MQHRTHEATNYLSGLYTPVRTKHCWWSEDSFSSLKRRPGGYKRSRTSICRLNWLRVAALLDAANADLVRANQASLKERRQLEESEEEI